mmetsp:Transcript_19801/g.62158  ORF Transcript_19801/g.62158 Transcript_19801/m.62158 type:complete len:254 (+) Transcript_19801:1252-2013(+)
MADRRPPRRPAPPRNRPAPRSRVRSHHRRRRRRRRPAAFGVRAGASWHGTLSARGLRGCGNRRWPGGWDRPRGGRRGWARGVLRRGGRPVPPPVAAVTRRFRLLEPRHLALPGRVHVRVRGHSHPPPTQPPLHPAVPVAGLGERAGPAGAAASPPSPWRQYNLLPHRPGVLGGLPGVAAAGCRGGRGPRRSARGRARLAIARLPRTHAGLLRPVRRGAPPRYGHHGHPGAEERRRAARGLRGCHDSAAGHGDG